MRCRRERDCQPLTYMRYALDYQVRKNLLSYVKLSVRQHICLRNSRLWRICKASLLGGNVSNVEFALSPDWLSRCHGYSEKAQPVVTILKDAVQLIGVSIASLEVEDSLLRIRSS